MGKYSDRLLAPAPAPAAAPQTPSQRLLAPAPAAPAPSPAPAPEAAPVNQFTERVEEGRKFSEGQRIKTGSGLMRAAEGVYQFTLDMAESAGWIEKGTADEFTKMTNEERAAFDREFKKEYGDKFGFAVSEFTGEMLPSLVVPAMGKTAMARAGAGIGAGALAGAAQFRSAENSEQRGSDRLMATGVGAAVGGAAAVGMEGLLALKNFVPKAMERARALKGDLVAVGLDVSKRTGVLFKLSQLAEDPAVEQVEAMARDSIPGERLGRAIEDAQPGQALKYFESLTDDKAANFGARVEATFKRVMGDEKAGTGLLGTRKRVGDADFKRAQTEGGKIFLKNTLTTINRLLDEFDVPGAGGTATQLVGELKDMRTSLMTGGTSALDAIAASNSRAGSVSGGGGALTPMQLQKNLERWGKAAKGTGKLFTDKVDRAAEKGPAKALFAALNRDLDDAVEAGGTGAEALRKARDNYAANTAKITAVRETALGKLFGAKEAPTREALEAKFLSMTPSEIRGTMNVLQSADPDAHRALSSFWLSRQIESARIPGQAGAIEFVPAKLLDMISGGKGPNKAVTNREVFDAVFTEPTLKRDVIMGLEAVKRIMVNNNRTSGRTVARLRNLAHVIATQDVGFTSRLATEIFAPEFVTKYVMDPKGVEALATLSKPFNDARGAAALVTLGNIAMRGMEAKQAPQEEHTVTATPLQ